MRRPSPVLLNSTSTTAAGIGSATVIATFGSTTTGENIRVWDPPRLAQLTTTTQSFNVNPLCIGEQVTNTANFSDGTTEDVTATTQWSPVGYDGYGFLSRTGYFSLIGNYTGYIEVLASMGRGLDQPRGGYIGVFGPCGGPTCSDAVKDGFETGVDCGGPACGPCASGAACLASSDCQKGNCAGLVCQ
jgi:hypothetical protein